MKEFVMSDEWMWTGFGVSRKVRQQWSSNVSKPLLFLSYSLLFLSIFYQWHNSWARVTVLLTTVLQHKIIPQNVFDDTCCHTRQLWWRILYLQKRGPPTVPVWSLQRPVQYFCSAKSLLYAVFDPPQLLVLFYSFEDDDSAPKIIIDSCLTTIIVIYSMMFWSWIFEVVFNKKPVHQYSRYGNNGGVQQFYPGK